MANLTPYFALLTQLRADLAGNLARMGVPATAEEPLQTLVPKVLQILQGDVDADVWSAVQIADFAPSMGFFDRNETVALSGMAAVAKANRVTQLRLDVTGDNAQAATVAGQGWTRSDITGGVRYAKSVSGLTRFDLQAELDALTLRGDGATSMQLTLSVGAVCAGGSVFASTGTTAVVISAVTAGALSDAGLTWAQMEAICPTWEKFDSLTKADILPYIQGGAT